MAKSYELIPDVKVTDMNDYLVLNKRLDTSKYKQFDRSLNGATVPTQAFVDKIAKNRAIPVCKSWIDSEHEQLCYEKMINADKSEIVCVPFTVAAKEYGWKSFKFSKDQQTVIPVK